jgi:hypothetical protein
VVVPEDVLRRRFRHIVYAQVILALSIALAFFLVVRQQDHLQVERQAGVISFCQTEFDTRLILADTLTVIANTPDVGEEEQTQAERDRTRRLADVIEERLRVLPEGCDEHVDVSGITITTPD